MTVRTFNISFPRDLADAVDKKAREHFGSRSDFLRAAAIKYLRDEEKIQEFRQLMKEGKHFANATNLESEEEVAWDFTQQRRKREQWRKS